MYIWRQIGRRWWLLTFLILTLGAAWTVYSRVPPSAASGAQIPSPREGFPAPEFTLNDLNGAPISLESLRGQVVVLNVWASL